MDSVTFQLVLHNPTGRSVPGTLTYHFRDLKRSGHDALTELAAAAVDRGTAEFTTFVVEGTFSAPALTGPLPIKIKGVSYISMIGPTLATIFNGNSTIASLGLEFNLIDSGGRYIGGGLSWRPEGPGSMQPWCLIGTQLD